MNSCGQSSRSWELLRRCNNTYLIKLNYKKEESSLEIFYSNYIHLHKLNWKSLTAGRPFVGQGLSLSECHSDTIEYSLERRQ